MKAKDTFLRFDAEGVKRHYREQQEEHWKQEGIKEVVEWCIQPCPHNTGFWKQDCDICWQSKLREWGV